ncbi:ChrR family anti-sigma-E factor [Alishewanella sp. SMS8]|uniref:ChrR family anti-sigma-E factor n=1 Tax=unclassified Alishewanella TaxID=2628974 RepID=UPI0027428A7B|nr:ChrR family anti-sigma-E factor [Alishewanella sp. SMS8]MDP4943983.1 ChrR family anti-sigma-E factor [Alishewanella sp.]MDP5034614.1 ChrR family anti-sigma-E factor [Alishewanella sp.]MDP5185725.1 ChrR family anti-sigma-E factor [Alishewanella sp.]MDP5458101.1 ChrR family anti-sigma-E factor [Alishewanella sp. SMS8]
MTHAVKFHPGMMLMEQYVEGTLSAEVALAVATHIDLCPHCQHLCQDLHNDHGSQLAKLSPEMNNNADDFAQMLDFITSQQPNTGSHAPKQQESVTVNVNGREFRIPRALSRLVSQQSKWLQLGGIATAKLPAGEKTHVSLLYIDKGTEVPNHSHLGMEMTLVLSGRIYDESGEYGAGDLLINSPDDTHTPHTRADEDCLCLSVLSAPLKFNKGLVRLLNPLQQFFY